MEKAERETKETTRKLCNNLCSWHSLSEDLLMVKEQGGGGGEAGNNELSFGLVAREASEGSPGYSVSCGWS